MNHDERFIELWNDYLEGELNESGMAELRTLIAQDNRLLRMAADSYQTHRLLGLIAEDGASRHDDFVNATLARLPTDHQHFVNAVMQRADSNAASPADRRSIVHPARTMALAAAGVLALIASVVLFQPSAEPEVAQITGWNGSVRWIGDGGRVVDQLDAGSSLHGGTLESLSADSWAALKFGDGSTVTIFGQSMLTVSQRDRKELHLRQGSLSARVAPQPAGKPMLIHTPTAKLEVLGTQLNVDAELSSTRLHVNEGRVRITRLADGRVTEVPAEHQVVASVTRLAEFHATRRPAATGYWRSDLTTDARQGKSGLLEQGESLRATPLLVKDHSKKQKPKTYYVAVLFPRSEPRPVALTADAKFRIRGWIESAAEVTFGVATQRPKGGFAGKYVTTRPAEAFGKVGKLFNVELPLADFRAQRSQPLESPMGLVLAAWWCNTVNEDAGLHIVSVELIPDNWQESTPESSPALESKTSPTEQTNVD